MRSSGVRDLKFSKGTSLKWRIKTVYWEVRYALERAWRGYDAPDVFDLWLSFVAKMPELIRQYKTYHDCLFTDLSGETPIVFTEEQTIAVLDEMIFCFENCDEDACYQHMFGVDPMDDYDSDHTRYFERSKQVSQEMRRCWEEGMKLFTKWGMQLWY